MQKKHSFIFKKNKSSLIQSCILFVLVFSFNSTNSFSQVMLNQVDNFNDGTTQNWSKGNNAPAGSLSNQNNMLQNIADGDGAGGKLTMMNNNQWTGDYLSAGVISIKMKITNVSSDESAHLRLVFAGTGGLGFVTQFTSITAVVIPSSTTMDVVFPIEEADLEKLQSFSSVSYQALFSDILNLRLIHSVGGSSANGDEINATLLFDDITACGNSSIVTTPYDENIDGDLSDDRNDPTKIALSDGNNLISSCQNGSPKDLDYLTFTVSTGKILERIVLTQFSSIPSSNQGFIGLQQGSILTEPPSGTNVANLLGGIIYGLSDLNSNILPEMAILGGAIGFNPPLTSNDYTLWLNQTSTESCITIDLLIADECPLNKSFTNEDIDSGIYKAINTITAVANVEITNNSNVIFNAGQCILFETDFNVPLSASFTANITACN